MARVALVAGIVVTASYLIGTVPVSYLLDRRSLRRSLRRLERDGQPLDPQLRTLLAGHNGAVVAALDTAKVLLASTLAWHLLLAVSPGGSATTPNQSAVAFLSDQVLVAWQSGALWAGAAAVAGHAAPPWLAFRGHHGHAPALGLAIAYAPIAFVAGVVTFFVSRAVRPGGAAAVVLGLGGFVAYHWVAWIFDWQLAWGVPNGPELCLWSAVLAGTMAARTLSAARQ